MKRRDIIPEENWVIVKNTYEPLIDELTWSRVQIVLKYNKQKTKPRPKKDGTISLFSGKVFCADCGAKMTFHSSKNGKYKEYPRYRCSTYNNQGKTACSFHAIREEELEAIVLNEIKKFSKIAVAYSDVLLNRLIDINSRMHSRSNSKVKKQLNKVERELQSIAPKIDLLLEQMLNGNVSEVMFKKIIRGYEEKQIELRQQLISLKEELNAIKDDTQHIKGMIAKFKERIYIENLNRETVVEMIDYIEIFKKEKIDNEYLQRVDIYFNFIGKISSDDFNNLRDYMSNIVSINPTNKEQVV